MPPKTIESLRGKCFNYPVIRYGLELSVTKVKMTYKSVCGSIMFHHAPGVGGGVVLAEYMTGEGSGKASHCEPKTKRA